MEHETILIYSILITSKLDIKILLKKISYTVPFKVNKIIYKGNTDAFRSF